MNLCLGCKNKIKKKEEEKKMPQWRGGYTDSWDCFTEKPHLKKKGRKWGREEGREGGNKKECRKLKSQDCMEI